MDLKEQGEKIRQARLSHGLKQKEVADFLGMSDKNYSKIELGQVGVNLEYVSKLCHILGMSELEFLADRRQRTKDWEDLLFSDIGGMFNSSINNSIYTDMLLKQYLSEEEITFFNEIMKIKNVEQDKRYMMLFPFMIFLDAVNKIKKDKEELLEYIKMIFVYRKNRLNGEFRS